MMARPASSYRAARRNRCHFGYERVTFGKAHRVSPAARWPGVQARYMPYFCKPPRIKWAPFPSDDAHSLDAVMVPFTDLRKQPRSYASH
jgi:hypothetical protein